jgi:hypothetical protein
MPLNEVQDYLDWLEALRRTSPKPARGPSQQAVPPPNIRPADLTGNEGADSPR